MDPDTHDIASLEWAQAALKDGQLLGTPEQALYYSYCALKEVIRVGNYARELGARIDFLTERVDSHLEDYHDDYS